MDELTGEFKVYSLDDDAHVEFFKEFGYPPKCVLAVVMQAGAGTIAGPILAENAVVYEPGEAR